MQILFVLPLLLQLWFSEPSASLECPACPAGTFQNCNCLPCPEGRFRREEGHFKEECEPCSIFQEYNRGNIIIHPCNATHDLETGCDEGYYRQSHDKLEKSQECTLCFVCEKKQLYTGRQCTNDSDTICCPEKGMVVVDDPETGLPECFHPGTDTPQKNNPPTPEITPKDKTQVSDEDNKSSATPPEEEKEMEKAATQAPETSTPAKEQEPPGESTCDSGLYYSQATSACEKCPKECSKEQNEFKQILFCGGINIILLLFALICYLCWENCRSLYSLFVNINQLDYLELLQLRE